MAIIKLDGGYNALPISYKRGNPIPLDTTAVWYNFDELQAYARTGVTAYVGQMLSLVSEVKNEENVVTGYTSTAYIISDTAGNLEPIGTAPVGDEKSIEVAEDGTVSLKGVSSLVFERAIVGEDGEPTGEKEEIQYQILMTKNGLTWVEPSKTTVEGLATLIDGLTQRVKALEDDRVTEQELEDAIKTVTDKIGDKAEPAQGEEGSEGYKPEVKASGVYAYVDSEIEKVEKAIGDITHFTTKIVESTDDVTEVGVLYLIKDADVEGVDKYNEYLCIDGNAVLIGDTTTDLSDYYTKGEVLSQIMNIDFLTAPVYNEEGKEIGQTVLLDHDSDTFASLDFVSHTKALRITSDRGVDFSIDDAEEDKAGLIKLSTVKGIVDDKIGEPGTPAVKDEDGNETAPAVPGTGVYAHVYSKSETLNLIETINGGATAGQVEAELKDYKASNDTRVKKIEDKLDTDFIKAIKVNGGEALTPDKNRAVNIEVPTSIVGLDGYTALNQKAQKGVDDAASASQAVTQLASGQVDANRVNIENLQALVGAIGDGKTDTLAGKIGALEAHDQAHTVEFNTLSGTVAQNVKDIAQNKADITTLNTTTIPALEQAISGKVAQGDFDALNAKVDTNGEKVSDYVAAQIAVSDTAVKKLISDEAERADAAEKANKALIEAIYKVDGDTNTGVLAREIARVEELVSTEAERADAAEKANAKAIADLASGAVKKNTDDIAAINTLLNTVDSEDTITSLKELAIWVEEHGQDAAEMAEGISDNAKAIAEIYTPASGEPGSEEYVEADGILVREVARLDGRIDEVPGAINAALEAAKQYTNDNMVKADGTSIINTNGTFSVGSVSTDNLVQGTKTLILNGGSASDFSDEE